jgi:ABC-type transport system involved in cytochrome c biogenesis permease component
MPTLTIAGKDLRLLLRDPRSAVILLLMPLLLILVLGLSLGDAFGRKPDDRLRISLVVEDAGLPPDPGRQFPPGTWADILAGDLADTADIRVEFLPDRAAAEALVSRGDRSAVVVLGPQFSELCQRCSFVGPDFKDRPINPLFRDGVRTDALGVEFLNSPTQPVGASVIQQVVQVSLLRIVIPWMIGQAFDQIGSDKFMDKMAEKIPEMNLAFRFLPKQKMGAGIQRGIGDFFSQYQFRAKTWAGLTKSDAPTVRAGNRTDFAPAGGLGVNRGAVRYQTLVPAYTVTFAFFLVLTVGWLFVAERRHGTLVRLRAAPLGRSQLLAGKVLPCFLVSVAQGALLLACGRLMFGMSWGAEPWLLLPVVLATAAAATGLAVLVAGFARTETQVAVYGTLVVLVLAGVSGSMMPRELMPDDVRRLSYVTPHAWALDAYARLLAPDSPAVDAPAVWLACGVLAAFGAGFLLLAWLTARLD